MPAPCLGLFGPAPSDRPICMFFWFVSYHRCALCGGRCCVLDFKNLTGGVIPPVCFDAKRVTDPAHHATLMT